MSDSVPNYQSDGMENFRANPTQRETSAPPAAAGGSGTPAGGTENLKADYKCFDSSAQKTPSGGSPPSIPQHFTDDKV
jgi:hypothetical protein